MRKLVKELSNTYRCHAVKTLLFLIIVKVLESLRSQNCDLQICGIEIFFLVDCALDAF